MTKEEMLSAIYEAMADKTLSDGCIVRNSDWRMRTIWTAGINSNIIYFGWCWCCEEYDKEWGYTTIWHPVRIGDVLDWFDKNNPEHLWWWNWVINGEIIVREWNNLRLPIDEQDELAIEFVYNLIKK